MTSVLHVGIAAAALAAISGCSSGQPQPVVTVTERAESEVTSSEEVSDDLAEFALDTAWDRIDYSDQENICFLFNYNPDAAWEVFSDGSEFAFTKRQFTDFFDSVC